MRVTIYLRVAKTKRGLKVDVGDKPNYSALKAGSRFLPTVSFGVCFDIPDELFKGASLLAGIINVNKEEAQIAAKVPKIQQIP